MGIILTDMCIFAGGALLGAIFGVLWGRKHPSEAAKLAAVANAAQSKMGVPKI
jgi:hypothetical protein